MWLMQTVISSIVAAGVVSVSACRSDSAATERVTVFSESMPAFSDVAFSRTSANMARRPNRPLSRRAIAALALHGGLDFVADAAHDLAAHLPVRHAGQRGDDRQQRDGDEGQQTLFEGHRISGGTDRVFPDANSAVARGSRRRSIRH